MATWGWPCVHVHESLHRIQIYWIKKLMLDFVNRKKKGEKNILLFCGFGNWHFIYNLAYIIKII
jgi:hypothetical protein